MISYLYFFQANWVSADPYITVKSALCNIVEENDTFTDMKQDVCNYFDNFETDIALGSLGGEIVFDTLYVYDLTKASEQNVLDEKQEVLFYGQVKDERTKEDISVRLVL